MAFFSFATVLFDVVGGGRLLMGCVDRRDTPREKVGVLMCEDWAEARERGKDAIVVSFLMGSHPFLPDSGEAAHLRP